MWGPFARHLTLEAATGGTAATEVEGPAADSSVAELVAGVERGLLVSDLWYTRLLDPRTLAVTGLTRNGLWLIEDGELTTPLRNFRFTQSYAQALMPGNVLAVGTAVSPVPGDTYTATSPRWSCPALRLAVVELHRRCFRVSDAAAACVDDRSTVVKLSVARVDAADSARLIRASPRASSQPQPIPSRDETVQRCPTMW